MLVIAESHLAPHSHQIYILHVLLKVKSSSIILNMNISWGLDGSVIISTIFVFGSKPSCQRKQSNR
jgi:hypothetical protein